MLTVPTRSDSEIRANQSFEALLWALSRPGKMRNLPEAGEALIIEALIDRECRVYSANPLLMPQILRTGAEVAELPQADHVFAGTLQDLSVLDQIAMGSDMYPDDGASLVVRATIGAGEKIRLTGPGVDGHLDLIVGGLPQGFWRKRTDVMRYPMGFDLFLIDGANVVGLPRSTEIEVL